MVETRLTEEEAASGRRNILEDIGAIAKACELMTTAIDEGRFIEGNAWLAEIKQSCGAIDDNIEALIHDEEQDKLGYTST